MYLDEKILMVYTFVLGTAYHESFPLTCPNSYLYIFLRALAFCIPTRFDGLELRDCARRVWLQPYFVRTCHLGIFYLQVITITATSCVPHGKGYCIAPFPIRLI